MRPGTYLGFDAGAQRLGVASGETITGSAQPLTVLRCGDGQPDWEAVAALIGRWRPVGLVVGQPLHADATASASTRLTDRFAKRLQELTGLPVYRIDERLSSRAAAERLRLAGRPAGARRERALDAVAAQIILETWFSTLGTGNAAGDHRTETPRGTP